MQICGGNNMKKTLAIVLILATLFLVGCNNPNSDDQSQNGPGAQYPDEKRFTEVTVTETRYIIYRAIEKELGYTLITDEPVRTNNGVVMPASYTFTLDTKYSVGAEYRRMSFEEYEQLQAYQNEFNIQVVYPNVKYNERPEMSTFKDDGNIYFVLKQNSSTNLVPLLDEDGNVIPNYWKYEETSKSTLIADYNSLRIEGADGIKENGVTYFYAYGRNIDGGIEVRVDYLKYCEFRDYIESTTTNAE